MPSTHILYAHFHGLQVGRQKFFEKSYKTYYSVWHGRDKNFSISPCFLGTYAKRARLVCHTPCNRPRGSRDDCRKTCRHAIHINARTIPPQTQDTTTRHTPQDTPYLGDIECQIPPKSILTNLGQKRDCNNSRYRMQ